MRWKLTTLLWAIGIFAGNLSAQIPSFTLKRYDDVPDLLNAKLMGIFPDSQGFIWLPTDAGLLRFDGSSFVAFRNIPGDSTSLAYNQIFCITEDKTGNLWLGLLHKGISMYDRRTGIFHNYPITSNLQPATALVAGIFLDKDGIVWAGVEQNGLIRLDPRTGETRQIELVTHQSAPHLDESGIAWSNQPYQFWQDPESGLIWMTTRDGLYVLDPKTEHCEPKRSSIYNYSDSFSYNMWEICPDGNELWSGGWESGLKRVNYRSNEHKQYFYNENNRPAPKINIVNSVVRLDDTFLWVATQDRGLGLFNKKAEKFYFFDKEAEQYPGLSKGAANHISADLQGNIWFASNNILFRITLDQHLFRSKTAAPSRPGIAIRQFFDDREGRFQIISTQLASGFKVLDKRNGKSFFCELNEPREKDKYKAMYTMGVQQAPDGTIWALSRLGLYRFNQLTQKLEIPLQPELPKNSSYFCQYTDGFGRNGIGIVFNGPIIFGNTG